MNTAMILRLGRNKVYAIELGRKQYHQVILQLRGDLGPLKYGDTVLMNMNTLEVTLIERETYEETA